MDEETVGSVYTGIVEVRRIEMNYPKRGEKVRII